MANKLATKNGNSGIRNRTNEPKFATVKPTENAKNKENNIENRISEFWVRNLKKPRTFSLINRKIVKIRR